VLQQWYNRQVVAETPSARSCAGKLLAYLLRVAIFFAVRIRPAGDCIDDQWGGHPALTHSCIPSFPVLALQHATDRRGGCMVCSSRHTYLQDSGYIYEVHFTVVRSFTCGPSQRTLHVVYPL
jgi:hypothetical protein